LIAKDYFQADKIYIYKNKYNSLEKLFMIFTKTLSFCDNSVTI